MFKWINRQIIDNTFSENNVVRRIKEGNREDFGKLYLKYIDPIYRYVFFRVNQDRPIAEDITENVFARALEKIESFDSVEGSFKTWIYTIAHNLVIDFYRHRQPEKQLVETDAIEHEDQEELFDKKIQLDSIEQALNYLSSEQREVIILRFLEDMSHKEIGRVLGKNEEAVRALQYRALKEIRRLLKEPELVIARRDDEAIPLR